MKEWVYKANLEMTYYQNISFSITGIFLVQKPLPIASINILNAGPKLSSEIPQS